MQYLLDHTLAILVTVSIVFMLSITNQRQSDVASEATSFYMLRRQQLSFVETLRRDMRNITRLESAGEDVGTGRFTFHARTEPGSMAEYEVEYRREWVVNEGSLNYYRIERYVDGQLYGGMTSLTSWSVVARNAEGVTVNDPADARQLYVTFEVEKPFSDGEDEDRAQWSSAFHPPLLQQNLTL